MNELQAALQEWGATEPVNKIPDTELIGLFQALIAFCRANPGKPVATARLLRAIATDMERDI